MFLTRSRNRTLVLSGLVDGYWCKHNEIPGAMNDNPDGMPEVRPSVDAPSIDFTYALQWLTYDVMTKNNPTITKKQWRSAFGGKVAFTNYHGFDDGSPYQRDYVNGTDMDAKLPKLMKAIICGGMLAKGWVEGNELVFYPGVNAVDANNPCSAKEVMDNGWYFAATVWYKGKTIRPFPQGNGGDVIIPHIVKERTPYPLEWFSKWSGTSRPNPYEYYEVT
jgi:hypothetical protein